MEVYLNKPVREVSKYGVFSGPLFPVFGLNTEIQENTDQK